MLAISITNTQKVKVHVPLTGKDRKNRVAPLEGPAILALDAGSEAFVSIELDASDPEGSTVIIKSVVDENTPAEPPHVATGTISRDARIGQDTVLVSEIFACSVTASDAVSMVLTADAPEEQE